MGEVRDGEDLEPSEDDEVADLDDDLDDDDLDDDEHEGGAGGVVGTEAPPLPPLAKEALAEILDFVARGLVENADAVSVSMVDREGGVTLQLSVDQPDMGKVIGRAGRTARALRTLMRAAGVRAGLSTHVEIVESATGAGGSGG